MRASVERAPSPIKSITLTLNHEEYGMLIGVLEAHSSVRVYDKRSMPSNSGHGMKLYDVGIVNSGCAMTILGRIKDAVGDGEPGIEGAL